jgi:tetratricopeptide (TPR) repeat protein
VYLSQSGRAADAEAFLATAYPTAAPLVRSDLANVWGNALQSQARYAEAAAKYRLAIHLKPRSWSAWTNLIGVLLFTDGEEGAYRTGVRMRQVAEAAPRADQPSPDRWVNFDFLPQDWSAELADIDFDARQMAGQGTSDVVAGQSLADTAARLHDFDAAARYLLASDPRDPNIRAERLFIQGYRALEEGAPARAVPPLEAFDAILRSNTSMQDSFADDACYLGLAYGLSGQAPKAEALFARRGRWVACYSFHADTLDHAGDWPGARAAYARAVAFAPDLPFAYDRWGQALLRHGDGAGAAAEFAAAHQRGPHWADPLKHWGDALASLGQWKAAAARYAQAAKYAPNLAALRLARSRASRGSTP